jgi:biotin carboxyl carrier protein
MQGYLIIGGEAHALSIRPAPGRGYRLPSGEPIALLTTGGRTRVQVGEATHEVEIAASGGSVWIHLDGRAHEVVWRDAVDFHAQASQSAQDGAVRAPMPGAVVSVLVRAGDTVSVGEAVLVIESMKLETTIRASRAGVVVGVRAAEGETFERGAVLVEIGE